MKRLVFLLAAATALLAPSAALASGVVLEGRALGASRRRCFDRLARRARAYERRLPPPGRPAGRDRLDPPRERHLPRFTGAGRRAYPQGSLPRAAAGQVERTLERLGGRCGDQRFDAAPAPPRRRVTAGRCPARPSTSRRPSAPTGSSTTTTSVPLRSRPRREDRGPPDARCRHGHDHVRAPEPRAQGAGRDSTCPRSRTDWKSSPISPRGAMAR